jgi:integrase
VASVDERRFETVLEDRPDRFPLHAGRFHRDWLDAERFKPVAQRQQAVSVVCNSARRSVSSRPSRGSRIAPYIYTEEEITALIAAVGRLSPPLRAARDQALIGLLAVTGMRPGEALAFARHDVDLRHGVVHVRSGKQKKQREVPVHRSTIGALRNYARLRDPRFREPSTHGGEVGRAFTCAPWRNMLSRLSSLGSSS